MASVKAGMISAAVSIIHLHIINENKAGRALNS